MEPANSPPINPLLVLALGVVGVSFSAIFVRMTSAPATVTAFYRLFFTCLLLTPLALRNRRQFRALNKGDLLLCLLSGMFLSFHFVLWFASLGLTSISSAALLVNIHPLLVVAGWRLFGSPLRLLGRAGVAGMAVLGWGDFQSGGTALSGNLLAAAGAAMLAGYYLLGRIARARISISAYSLLVYGTSALLLLAYNLASSAPLSGFPATDWLAFAGLAVLPTLCGHTLLNWALKYLPASAISVGVLGEPIIATILALPFYGEIPGPLQLAGGALAVAGIWMFLRRS